MKLSNEASRMYDVLRLNEAKRGITRTCLEILFLDLELKEVSPEQIPFYKRMLLELQDLGYIKLYHENMNQLKDLRRLKKKTAFKYEICK